MESPIPKIAIEANTVVGVVPVFVELISYVSVLQQIGLVHVTSGNINAYSFYNSGLGSVKSYSWGWLYVVAELIK